MSIYTVSKNGKPITSEEVAAIDLNAFPNRRDPSGMSVCVGVEEDSSFHQALAKSGCVAVPFEANHD